MKSAYKIKDIEKFKTDLRELNFVNFDFVDCESEKNKEFLIYDNRITSNWDRFWARDWLGQVLQDKATEDYFICFDDCNKFKSLELEEIISFIKIILENIEK